MSTLLQILLKIYKHTPYDIFNPFTKNFQVQTIGCREKMVQRTGKSMDQWKNSSKVQMTFKICKHALRNIANQFTKNFEILIIGCIKKTTQQNLSKFIKNSMSIAHIKLVGQCMPNAVACFVSISEKGQLQGNFSCSGNHALPIGTFGNRF